MSKKKSEITEDIGDKRVSSFMFNTRIWDMISQIMLEEGWDTYKEAVQACIVFKHRKLFPTYSTALNNQNALTPDEKAILYTRKMEQKERYTTNKKIAKYTNICVNVLKGQVAKNETGADVCVIPQYDVNGKFGDYSVPLTAVTEDMLNSVVFQPTRDIVFAKQPEIRKLYEKDTD